MFRTLNSARRSAIESRPAFLTTLMRPQQLNNHTIALTKPPLLSVLNNYGPAISAVAVYLSPHQTAYKPLLPIIDVLSGQIFSTDPRGGLTIPILMGEPRVFLPLAVYHGVTREEVWASAMRVDTDAIGAVTAPPLSPGSTHRKRASLGAVISWLGGGTRDKKPERWAVRSGTSAFISGH